MQRYSLMEICKLVGEEYVLHNAAEDIYIVEITTPQDANEHSLVFISSQRKDKQALFAQTRARVIICDEVQPNSMPCLIVVKDPKYTFAKIANALFMSRPEPAIHPTANIHPQAKIGKNVHIGPNVYIGQCELKENVVIYGNSYLYDNVTIAANVIVHAGCIIGARGCGHIKGEDGRYQPFPHVGGVIIGEGVEIGANSCIAKGALANTIIKPGVVIDSFVQIGHNVIIEENVLILANSVIGGSSVIHRDAVLAIGTHICDYVTVGEKAHVGPGSVVIKNVPAGAKLLPRAPLTMAI